MRICFVSAVYQTNLFLCIWFKFVIVILVTQGIIHESDLTLFGWHNSFAGNIFLFNDWISNNRITCTLRCIKCLGWEGSRRFKLSVLSSCLHLKDFKDMLFITRLMITNLEKFWIFIIWSQNILTMCQKDSPRF